MTGFVSRRVVLRERLFFVEKIVRKGEYGIKRENDVHRGELGYGQSL